MPDPSLMTTARMTGHGDDRPPGDADLRGLYGPGSEAWALNREAMLLLGAGPRALLMQLAHPAVAAGVADHSDFRADPWPAPRAPSRAIPRSATGPPPPPAPRSRAPNSSIQRSTGPPIRPLVPAPPLGVHPPP